MIRMTMILISLTLGFGGCKTAIHVSVPRLPPKERLVVVAQTLENDIQRLKHEMDALDVTGDPNQRPIRFWAIKSSGGVERLYILGHADGACCPIVSGLVSKVVQMPEFKKMWFSYGIGVLDARGSPVSASVLKHLVEKIAKVSTTRACAGQVSIQWREHDTIEAMNQRLLANANMGYRLATKRKQPLLLWYPGADGPNLVPALAPSDDGELRPFTVELPAITFDLPPEAVRRLSLDGIGQYIISIRARIERLDELAKAQVAARAFTDKVFSYGIGHTSYGVNYRAPKVEARIDETISNAQQFQQKWNAMVVFAELYPNTPQSYLTKQAMLQRALSNIRVLSDVIGSAESARRQLQRLPGTALSRDTTEITFQYVTPRASKHDAGTGKFIDSLLAMDLTTSRSRLETAIAQARSLKSNPPPDPIPVLVDAFLRGWPATFSSERAEDAYDRWANARQKEVWEIIRRKMRDRGIRLGGKGPGALQHSNVLFRVRKSGSSVFIQPYFAFAGPFFQVMDPLAGFVRYESAVADQNLLDMRRALKARKKGARQ